MRVTAFEGLNNDAEPYHVHFTKPAAERELVTNYTSNKCYPESDGEIVEISV